MADLRAWHRWLGFAGSVALVFIAGTGLALHIDKWKTAPPPEFGAAPPALAPQDLVQAPGLLDRAQKALDEQSGGFVPGAIELGSGPSGLQVRFLADGPLGPSMVFDDTAGLRAGPPPIDPGLHRILQDLHAGYLGGRAGEIISFLAGLALLMLGVTGLVLHWRVWRQRWKRGRRTPFWK